MNSNQMYRRLACMLCAAVLLLTMPYAAALAEPQAPGATFAVNTTADTQDANPGNGICADGGGSCSLRAAVREANALPGADTITLPAGTYGLTQAGGGEDAGSTGDLDISSTLTINGAGIASTTVDANNIDRVFHILSTGVVTITQVTIQDGTPPNVGSDVNARSGGGVRNDGRLTMSYARVTANRAANGAVAAYPASRGGLGGGIYSYANSVLNLDYVNIDANYAGNGANGDSQNHGEGGSGGGIASNGATVTIQNSQVTNNWSGDAGDSSGACSALAGNGGGIYISNGAVQVSTTTFSANYSGIGGDAVGNFNGCSGGWGGGIYITYANATISGSTIENNHTSTGGAGGAGYSGGYGGSGGGIVYLGETITLSDTTINNNSTAAGREPSGAGGNGGGFMCAGTLNATNLTLSENFTGAGGSGGAQGLNGGHGGGMYASNSGGTISSSEIRGNHTGNGGAGIDSGSYGGYGGGIYFTSSYTPLNLVEVSVEANYTGNGGAATSPGNGGRGGGIFADSPVNLTRATLSGNYTGNGGVGGEGGGFYGYGTIVNSTISGNHTGSPGAPGGGLMVMSTVDSDILSLVSSTVAFNQASGTGGGVRSQYNRFYARNSILGYNGASVGIPDCSGSMQSQGYNLVGSTAGCAITLGGGELLNTIPYLFALGDNGGPTKTHAFQYYSPALDRANPATPGSGGNACPITDQRGQPRDRPALRYRRL